jgi:hypothetical protein
LEWLLREVWTTVRSSIAMSKKEIIKKIREITGCTEEKAEIIFKKGIEDENIIVRVDWEWIMNRVIIAAIIVTGLWALWRHIG